MKKHAIIIILTITFALIICGAVSATSYTDIYVSPTGDDSNDGGDPLHPAQTIDHALEVTQDNGSTVHLANGVYSGTGNTNISLSKNMTIKGQSQTGTIINGTGTNWMFYIPPGINVTIMNLTLTNGKSSYGGAICDQGNLTVTSCTFIGNTATSGGGAIDNDGNLTVTGSTFNSNNAAAWGGAIENNGNLTVTISIFTDNTAANNGGAIDNIHTLIVTGCTFTGNNATGIYPSEGGAICNGNKGNLTVTGSTFNSNNANYGGAIWNDGGLSTTPVTISGSTFTENAATHLGGAIYNTIGTVNIYFNRIVGNTASHGSAIYDDGGNADAPLNWWGDNNDPSGKLVGLTVTKWLVLTIKAVPSSISAGSKSTITADLIHDNTGAIPTGGHLPEGIPVTFSGTLGNINPLAKTVNGIATTTFTGLTPGNAVVKASVDNQTVTSAITIKQTWKRVAYTYTVYVPVKKWYKKWYKSHGKWRYHWKHYYVKIWVKKWHKSHGKWRYHWVKVKKYKKVHKTGYKWVKA